MAEERIRDHACAPLQPRQSNYPSSAPANISLRRSNRLNVGKVLEYEEPEEGKEKRPENTSSMTIHRQGKRHVYNPVYGICCHFCRQKILCAEEDCKRCCNFDLDQSCIQKTDCSVCHSSYGVLCRSCLLVRYGEELEEVRENKEWMCPHCIEEKGIKPCWICNSSFCLKNRKMAPKMNCNLQSSGAGIQIGCTFADG